MSAIIFNRFLQAKLKYRLRYKFIKCCSLETKSSNSLVVSQRNKVTKLIKVTLI